MIIRDLLAYRKSNDKEISRFVKNILGFYPENIVLYQLAFTHKSTTSSNSKFKISNERLEYLGDAVLELAVADFLFHTYPTQQEGFLTEMRSRIVSRASLNKLSQKLGFDSFIKCVPNNDNTGYKSLGGNTFEALMGAIYLDKGFDFSKKVIINRIIRVHLDLDQLQQTEINFKSRLLEWGQKNKRHVDFRMIETNFEGHRKLFHVQIFIDNKAYADATDFSIKGAEQLSAEKTWNMLTE